MPFFVSSKALPGTRLRVASLIDAQGGDTVLSRPELAALAAAGGKVVFRIGGGAAKMKPKHGKNIGRKFALALGGKYCNSAVLAGATASYPRPTVGECGWCDYEGVHCPNHGFGHVQPLPGVMETLVELALMQKHYPKPLAKTIGVVPTIQGMSLYGGFLMINNDETKNYYTVVDGRAPLALVVQLTTDRQQLTYEDEWKVCLKYMQLIREDEEHQSVHLFANGGKVTFNEIMHVVQLRDPVQPWNVFLVSDSGRVSAKLAANVKFRKKYPHVEAYTWSELGTVLQQKGLARDPGVDYKEV